jgi:hypothetical protein
MDFYYIQIHIISKATGVPQSIGGIINYKDIYIQ